MEKIKLLLGFVSAIWLATACQQEVTEIIEPPADKVFTQQSDVAGFMQRTSMNDGSGDNIIDGASCTQLVLPVTIEVNGQELNITSADDFTTVERIIDEFDDDDDDIEFHYPITVVFADFTKVVVNNHDQFEDLIKDCQEGMDDDDIECVDFIYPISISVYNTDNQVSRVVTIETDEELHHFLEDLDEKEYAGFTFPVRVLLADNTEVVINTNSELENTLKSADGSCDEDDDLDHDDDDVDDSSLVAILTTGQWKISYFFDDKDETGDFSGYLLTFLPDGTAKAVKGTNTINGTWLTSGDDGALELDLNFGEVDPLDEISEDWDVSEFSNASIKLFDVSGGDGTTDYLTLARP